jgi:site-specific DNA-methyltransferase (adenine-specific)
MQLLQGDCLELMKTLPDKSVDLFVCDLPFGCLSTKANGGLDPEKYGANRGNGGNKGCAWDIKIDLEQFWVQVKRLCKDDHVPVLMFCTARYGYELIKSNEAWFRYDLIWNKKRGVSFLMANKMPMRSHELIYVFSKKGARYYRIDMDAEGTEVRRRKGGKVNPSNTYNGGKAIVGIDMVYPAGKRCPLSIIDAMTKAGRGHHPTQKPDELYEWLITRYSKEGDTILDPTAGSFASVFTAERLGGVGIGMEMDEDFFNKAVSKHGIHA